MTEDQAPAVHYEVEYSATGDPPWLIIRTAMCPVEAQRLAREALGRAWVTHSRIRRVTAAKSVEVVEIIEATS